MITDDESCKRNDHSVQYLLENKCYDNFLIKYFSPSQGFATLGLIIRNFKENPDKFQIT